MAWHFWTLNLFGLLPAAREAPGGLARRATAVATIAGCRRIGRCIGCIQPEKGLCALEVSTSREAIVDAAAWPSISAEPFGRTGPERREEGLTERPTIGQNRLFVLSPLLVPPILPPILASVSRSIEANPTQSI